MGSVVLTLVYVLLPAAAASPAGVAAAAPQDEAAQQEFRAGVDAARQENWIAARTAFQKAYELSPRPVVLINLAGAQARTGRLTEAAKNYHRILEEQSGAETASMRRAAAEVLPELEARIPRVRLRPTGLSPTDVIQIDGETYASDVVGVGQPLDPGDHTLVVKAGAVERARVLFTLAEREQREITLPLPPPEGGGGATLAPPLGSSESGGVGSSASEAPRAWWRSPWTWTAVAIVVVGASIAGYVIYERRDQPYVGSLGNVPIH